MPEADVAKIQGILIGWIALVQYGDGEANDGHLERSVRPAAWSFDRSDSTRSKPLVRTNPNKIQLKNPRVGGMSL